MNKPWWAKLPERLSRLAFAFVLMWDNAVIKKCQYCGSWKMRSVVPLGLEDAIDSDEWTGNFVCEKCGAECVEVEHWTEGVIRRG